MDKLIFRMSEVGHCPKRLCAEYLNLSAEAPPSWLEQAAEEGNWHEQRIKSELRQNDIAVTAEQQEVTLEYPAFKLIGHIDGIIYNHNDEPILLEVKSMSQFEFDRWMKGNFAEFSNYAAQLTCYLTATAGLGVKTATYIVKNRNSGYQDERTITRPPVNIDIILSTLNEVSQYISKGELYSKDFDSQSIECRRCLYKALCVKQLPKPDLQTEIALTRATELWREGTELAKQGEDMVEEAKQVLLEHTKATSVDRWTFNKLAISLSLYLRINYDKKLLEQYLTPEQLAPAKKEQEITQLRITDLAKKENNG